MTDNTGITGITLTTDEGSVTVTPEALTTEYLGGGVWKLTDGKVGMFVGRCEDGEDCHWTLAPDYRTFDWVAHHNLNPEAALVFKCSEPFDPGAMLDAIDDWVIRCHEYELERVP